MRVLGISAFFHDAAAALVDDGVIVAAAQEERFSRIKHDATLPVEAVKYCLREAGITIDDVDHVVFYEKPLRRFERILVTHLREFPRGILQFPRAMRTWLSPRLAPDLQIANAIGCAPERVSFSEHHLSHAASAFLCSPFESAAVITADGVGEWATTSIYKACSVADGSTMELVEELHFPHSIGLVYSAVTAYLGFEVNEGEYKVMGLAAYGEPRFLPEFERICKISADGSIAVDSAYFSYARHPTKSFTRALERLLGPARRPHSPLCLPAGAGTEDARFADVASSLQALTERYLLIVANEAKKKTGERNLAMAGGVALNAVANRKILEDGPFDALFVQPAAGDAGGALGAALHTCHVLNRVPRRVPAMSRSSMNPFLGEAHDGSAIEAFLRDCGVEHVAFQDRTMLHEEVSTRLLDGQVCGWLQGRFEWGPRALGARSILADPRDPNMRDRVNVKIKNRESFRPFAPAVLADEMERWFVPVQGRTDHTSPFMTSVAPATPEAKRVLPSVVHVDGTARAQRVDRDSSPRLYDLLEHWRERSGVGVLLNTSLNLNDEPICGSPAEAYGAFVRSDLDFLVLEHCLIEKRRLS